MAEKERGVRWRCYLCPSLFHWLFLGFVSGCVFVFVFVVVVVIVFVIVFFIVINLSLSSILPFELQRRLGSNDGRERKRSSLTLPSLPLSLSLSFIKCHCRCHCHQFVIAAESNWSGVQLGPMMAEKEIADSQNPTFPPSAPLCWIFSKSICQSKKNQKFYQTKEFVKSIFFHQQSDSNLSTVSSTLMDLNWSFQKLICQKCIFPKMICQQFWLKLKLKSKVCRQVSSIFKQRNLSKVCSLRSVRHNSST